LIWSKSFVADERSLETALAHPGLRESFLAIVAKAREILRERGLTEDQIEAELNRAKREERFD
jgi:hypothetical protein